MFGARRKGKGDGDKDKRDPPKDKGKPSRDNTPENKTPKKRKRKPSMVSSNSDMEIGDCLPCSPFSRSPRKTSQAKSAIEEGSLSTTDSGINTASISETSSSRPAEPLAGPSTLATTKTKFKSSNPSSSGLNTSSTSASSINFSDKRQSLSSHEASTSSSRNASTRSKSGEQSNLLKHGDKAPSSPKVPTPISAVEPLRTRSQTKNTDTGSTITKLVITKLKHMQLGQQISDDNFLRSSSPRNEGPCNEGPLRPRNDIPFIIPKPLKPDMESLPHLKTEDDKQNFTTQVTSSLDVQQLKEQLASLESVDPQEGTSKGPSQKTPKKTLKKTTKYIPISKESSDESDYIAAAVAATADTDSPNKEKLKNSKYKNGFSRFETSKKAASPKKAAPSPKKAAPSPQKAAPSPKKAAPSPKKAAPSPKKAAPSKKAASSKSGVVNFIRRKSMDNKSTDDGSNLSAGYKDSSSDGNKSKISKRRKKLTRQMGVDRGQSSSSSEDIADK